MHGRAMLRSNPELYDIQDRGKSLSAPERQQLRHAEARPIWERSGEYLASDRVVNVMPKEVFGKAVTFSLFSPVLRSSESRLIYSPIRLPFS